MGNKARFLHFPGTLPAGPPSGDVCGGLDGGALRRFDRPPRYTERAGEVDLSAGKVIPLRPLRPNLSLLRIATKPTVRPAPTVERINPFLHDRVYVSVQRKQFAPSSASP